MFPGLFLTYDELQRASYVCYTGG